MPAKKTVSCWNSGKREILIQGEDEKVREVFKNQKWTVAQYLKRGLRGLRGLVGHAKKKAERSAKRRRKEVEGSRLPPLLGVSERGQEARRKQRRWQGPSLENDYEAGRRLEDEQRGISRGFFFSGKNPVEGTAKKLR